jgi:hypothetical protein
MMQKPGSDCAEEKSPSQARPTLDRKKDSPRGLKRGALRSEPAGQKHDTGYGCWNVMQKTSEGRIGYFSH